MNIKIVSRVLAFLLIFLGISMLIPLPFSLYYGSGDHLSFIITAAICLSFGTLAFMTLDKRDDLKAKDGFAIVTFGWIIMSLFGAFPYMISGAIPSFTDAFFESISGFTTTGSTILTEIEGLPEGILLWRSLTHWIGGMGIIVLTIAILPFLGIGGMQMFKAESPGPISDKLKPRITHTAKILWGVYVALTAAELILLMFGGMNFYEALNHALSTMATGGFSTQNDSAAGFSPYIHYVIILFMFIAGTNFSLQYRVLTSGFKNLFRNPEFKVYVSAIFIATAIIFTDVYLNLYDSAEHAFRDTIFQILAINTTTGFATADYELWSTSSQALLYIMMFMGGMAGSTAGGMKVIRIMLLFKFAIKQFIRLVHPRAVIPIRVGDHTIDDKTMYDVLGYFVLFVFIAMASLFALTLMGVDLITAFGAVAACMNNIGPGLGKVGPTDNYAFFSVPAKWLLSFLMLIGRLEILTVIILLSPSYWKK